MGTAAGGTGSDFALARYHPNGTLDTTFGKGGRVTTDFGFTNDSARAVAVRPDGTIVAAGYAGATFAVAQYLPGNKLAVANVEPAVTVGGQEIATEGVHR